MSLVRNERLKLLANALDRASTACVTVGIVTPVAGLVYGLIPHVSALALAAACFVWLFVAVSLHLAARRVLGRLLE
ncbi:MAG: hypothetical protein JOZ17_20185 [Acetobacteraceae bacterium]|nr:hypothetical protein [Acetobacteraceae bacterium]